MIKIGINGFGRIGRLAFRVAIENNNVQVVAINDAIAIEDLAYLLKYDSVHGRFRGTVSVCQDKLIVNNFEIRITSEKKPQNIGWDEVGVDYVIESTGLFTDKDKAMLHIQGGAKKVVISAPSKDANMYVLGVNHHDLTKEEFVFSNASCTTNCLAPIIKVIDESFGFEQGLMTTVHSATAKQGIVDSYNSSRTRGRSALTNLIPTTTNAEKAVAGVYPPLGSKLKCMAIRVPIVNVSLIDLTFTTSNKNTTLSDVLGALKNASETTHKGIIGYTEDEVVSQDFVSETCTSVVDQKASMELNGTAFFKLVAWYDNEFGYANKIIDLIIHAASL